MSYAASPLSLDTRTRLINTSPWWGGGTFPPSSEEGGREAGKELMKLMNMVYAVLDRRAAVHIMAIHVPRKEEGEGGREGGQMGRMAVCACSELYSGFQILPQVREGREGGREGGK